MKKIILLIGLIIGLTAFYESCSDQKSMQEYIREEEQAIERFIQKQNLRITESWPGFEAFEKDSNLYYKTNGSAYVYMHVIDKGDLTRKVKPLSDEVQVRFDTRVLIKNYIAGDSTATIPFDSFFNYYNLNVVPMTFRYGNPASYTQDGIGLACVGWAIPLTPDFEGALGEKARINIIIPSVSGSSGDNSTFCPVFYENLRYTAFY